jgi:activator of 2-hydroxyglutaryl-CoA dehydratase
MALNTSWFRKLASFTPPKVDNPFTRAIGAGAATAAAIAATTAFAPVGAVGAGWAVVYGVATGTLTLDSARKFIRFHRQRKKEKQKDFEQKLENLKRALEEGAITEEQFQKKVQEMLEIEA